MKVGSLFSGIGGIELGLERAGGFEPAWFVENNPYAAAVLRKHWPNATVYGDITKTDFRTVSKVDILTGGFPCQDISTAGKRVGITGSRSSLWKYYAEAIRVLRPKYAIIENVSALTKRGFYVVLSDLAALGYDAEWHCISASSVGAPHRRDRIFIISHSHNNGQPSAKISERFDKRIHDNEKRTVQASELARPSQQLHELACPNGFRCFHGQTQEQSTERGKQAQCGFIASCEDVSDTDLQGLQGQHESEYSGRESKENARWGAEWEVESRVCRTTDGVPSRVDRIKCLGNAVVPQIAQIIGEAIKEVEECRCK